MTSAVYVITDTVWLQNLTLAQADAAVAAVEAGPRPTLVQCMSGGRAGAVALMYEAKKQHWTVEQVRARQAGS